MLGKEAKIYIGICTYNRAESLKRTLESALNLDYRNYKIVVIDNNSADNTIDIVKLYPQVIYLLEKKQGIAYARNRFLAYCIEKNDAEYIGFIDDDETLPRNWLSSMLDCFKTNKRIAVVTGAVIPVYEILPPEYMPDGLHNAYENKKEINTFYEKFSALTGNCLFKYQILKEKGIRFNENLGRKGKILMAREDTKFFSDLVEPEYLYGFTCKAFINHYIEKERLTFKYFARRFFYEGVSEYYCKNKTILIKSLFKLFIQMLHFIIVLFTFKKNIIVERLLKVIKTIGILCAPLIKI